MGDEMKRLILVLFLLTACTASRFTELYQPGATHVSLWRSESIPLDAGWKYLGAERVTVRGQIWNSSLMPADEMQTMIFVRQEAGIPSLLFLSRVIKTSQTEIFTFLGGTKTVLNGTSYRESEYSLTSNSTDPEYRRYFELVRTTGHALAPGYSVRVLDRLPLDTVLVRSMELTPSETISTLPPFARLYQQEQIETLLRLRQ